MDVRSDEERRDLEQLQQEFTGHRIWRAKRWDGLPGEWVATLHDPSAGVSGTVMEPSAGALREELVRERAAASKNPEWN